MTRDDLRPGQGQVWRQDFFEFDFELPVVAKIIDKRHRLSRIERQLSKLSGQEERVHAEMSAKAADHAAVLGLNDTLRAIVDERETLELEWLSFAEMIG